MGLWTYGQIGLWAYGLVDLWTYGRPRGLDGLEGCGLWRMADAYGVWLIAYGTWRIAYRLQGMGMACSLQRMEYGLKPRAWSLWPRVCMAHSLWSRVYMAYSLWGCRRAWVCHS